MRGKVARSIREVVGYKVGSPNGLVKHPTLYSKYRFTPPLIGLNDNRAKYKLIKKHYSKKVVQYES